MLNLGGMENSLPKTTQTPNRFRVARNVQPSVDGRIIPRSSYESQSGQPASIEFFPLLKDYNNSVFKMALYNDGLGGEEYRYYLQNTRIPQSSFQGGAVESNIQATSLNTMSFQKNNTLYILNPRPESSFFKYDGVEITGCGSPQPRFSCAEYNSSGTKWIKVIQHRVDFDDNQPASETVTFPILNATNSITIRTDGLAVNIVNPANQNVSPGNVIQSNSNTMSDLFFFSSSVTYNSTPKDFTVVTTDTNISSASIGSYVFVANTTSTIPTYWLSASTGVGNIKLLAMKVKSVNPLTNSLVLDAENAKGIKYGGFTWEDLTILSSNMADVTNGIKYGGRKLFTVWSSSSKTGNYVLKEVDFAFPESTAAIRSFTVDTTTVVTSSFGTTQLIPISIGLNLGDWYSVDTKKISMNTDYSFGGSTGFLGMTSYQDQILWWNDDLIYFSDPTLGGSIEHTSASAFIRVGDTEYGKVVSCCGTQDYLVVSRERKNYFINGNLATGNYRVQDIADIEVGAWCNNGLINIKDSVVMINATGVWQIQGGGRVSHLSKQIPKNFSIYDALQQEEDVAFRLNGFSTFPITQPYVDTGLEIAFDEFREYLVFCQRSSPGTPVLVLHTKTGEFYEWNGFEESSLRGMTFVRGVLYYGTVDTVGYTSVVKNETPLLSTQDYADTYPIKLYSTWLTAEEPSLEKQLLQLKMFGAINSSDSYSINVVHFKDWNLTKITNSPYIPDSSTQYSHLKRLNSDKVLAASVGLEVDTSGVTFAIESMEIEFNAIQQGIKR